MKKQEELTIIIPVSLEGDHQDARGAAESILYQHNTYGFKYFGLFMPGKGWRSVSYPPREYFEQKAALIQEIKALLPREIKCGWWHTLVLKSGPTPNYTRIVRMNGTEAPFSTCPLDPAYRKRFAEDAAFVLHKARPDFFITEDDFGINCHGGEACFCKHHLEEFARREGKYYSREELEILFTEKKNESRELLRRWQLLARDSLALFAKAIREEADKLTPEIPMGIMQPGCSGKDGNAAETVARAIAGKNHTPFVRFHGTFYCGERIAEIPGALFSPLYAREHIKGEFRFIHESDTYPHTRFYTSSACMRAMMGAVYSCGYEGSVFQTQQMLDNPNEEEVYGSMFHRERVRFNALYKSVDSCTLQGAQIFYDPFDGNNFEKCNPQWLRVLSAFGIPFTTRDDADIVFFSGEQMRFMSDEKIKEYLSKTVFLDGHAAKVLTERHLAELIGVKTSDLLIQGNDRFDLGAKEMINASYCPDLQGRQMARADMYCPRGTGELFRLDIIDDSCEEVTQIVNFKGEHQAPGMTFFRNKLGGTAVVFATSLANHFGSSLFNYRRQALFQELLVRCGADFPMVQGAANFYLIVNKPQQEKDFKALFTCTNLAVDPHERIKLHLPDSLRSCKEFRFLDLQGKWQKMEFERDETTVTFIHNFNYAEPVYISAR